MKKLKRSELPKLLRPLQGGFYTGLIDVNGSVQAVIRAPKAEGSIAEIAYGTYGTRIKGADSFCDSAANTAALAKAGSPLGKWARGLTINGHKDWVVPAMDVTDLMYRHGKPGTNLNSCYMRSGINLHSVPVGHPYTEKSPKQAALKLFQTGGAEAFDETIMWASTQYDADYAWCQHFSNGSQSYGNESYEWRGWAVRMVPVIL